MNDDEWIASLKTIKTPREALKIILENERFFGYDPYYSDLREAMLQMVERILKEITND